MTTDLSELPPELRELLADPDVEAARDAELRTWSPGLRLSHESVSDRPLRPGCVGKLLGKTPAPPVLSITTSKLGGAPYVEGDYPQDARGNRLPFVGQLNFAELATEGLDLPSAGLFVLFLNGDIEEPFRWFWYPEHADDEAVPAEAPSCVMPYEERITAAPAFNFDWGAVDATVPDGEWPPLLDELSDWTGTHGADFGTPWPEGLEEVPGPRSWCGDAPTGTARPTLLWTPDGGRGHFMGSSNYSLLAPPGRLVAGDLSTLHVLYWQ